MANPSQAQVEATGNYSASSATLTSVGFTTQNCTIGSTIVVWLAGNNNLSITSVIDSNGQSYSPVAPGVGGVNSLYQSAGPTILLPYAFKNNAFANKPTVTVTWATTQIAPQIRCSEWINVPTTGADGCNIAYVVNPGITLNAITCPVTPNNAVSGYGVDACLMDIAGTGGLTLLAGTPSFTANGAWNASGSYAYSMFEYAYLTGSGTQTALASDPTHGATVSYLFGAILFDGPAVVGGNFPLPTQVYVMP
jgi:hypothetical protein